MTRWPLSVSPLLSSTSMGWPWAAFSRPRGSFYHVSDFHSSSSAGLWALVRKRREGMFRLGRGVVTKRCGGERPHVGRCLGKRPAYHCDFGCSWALFSLRRKSVDRSRWLLAGCIGLREAIESWLRSKAKARRGVVGPCSAAGTSTRLSPPPINHLRSPGWTGCDKEVLKRRDPNNQNPGLPLCSISRVNKFPYCFQRITRN